MTFDAQCHPPMRAIVPPPKTRSLRRTGGDWKNTFRTMRCSRRCLAVAGSATLQARPAHQPDGHGERRPRDNAGSLQLPRVHVSDSAHDDRCSTPRVAKGMQTAEGDRRQGRLPRVKSNADFVPKSSSGSRATAHHRHGRLPHGDATKAAAEANAATSSRSSTSSTTPDGNVKPLIFDTDKAAFQAATRGGHDQSGRWPPTAASSSRPSPSSWTAFGGRAVINAEGQERQGPRWDEKTERSFTGDFETRTRASRPPKLIQKVRHHTAVAGGGSAPRPRLRPQRRVHVIWVDPTAECRRRSTAACPQRGQGHRRSVTEVVKAAGDRASPATR